MKQYYMVAQRPFSGKSGGLWDIGWMTYKTEEDMREMTRQRAIGIQFRYW